MLKLAFFKHLPLRINIYKSIRKGNGLEHCWKSYNSHHQYLLGYTSVDRNLTYIFTLITKLISNEHTLNPQQSSVDCKQLHV